MKHETAQKYRCPYSGLVLELTVGQEHDGEIVTGTLTADGNTTYPLINGIPRLISENDEVFSEEEKRENEYYESTAREYDAIMDWMFRSFNENEAKVRAGMVDLLNAGKGSRVLETGAGTCRDSMHIVKTLNGEGEVFIQDLSPSMLSIGRDRLQKGLDARDVKPEFFVGNAVHLPFPDGYFDAAFHFGGLNVFSDRKAAIAEMARVVRAGGKVVFGDEGLAPWRRETEYGQILMNSSKLYSHEPPIQLLPDNARDAAMRWIIGDAYYLIDFVVGDAPALEMDMVIPGKKGGTHRSRWADELRRRNQ
ncbi:MAG: class I SAM-dependent methyltransferase [Gemmatimonadaceae bacterium]|nr:class I SAM-dependent methyltransferase [Gemmatimonadaceae bacterium]